MLELTLLRIIDFYSRIIKQNINIINIKYYSKFMDQFKVVLYPKFDEMCGFRKITKRGLLNVLKRIHVTFSIAIHSKSRYSANSASG